MKTRTFRQTLMSAVMTAGLVIPGAAAAQDAQKGQDKSNAQKQMEDVQPNPYTQPDESWITLTGTVESSDTDSFVLDYGDGTIIVEMDDWDAWGDAAGLIAGDDVTVTGRVDDDFFELATIEAGSVYVENLDTHFFASPDDEEDDLIFSTLKVYGPLEVGQFSFTGTVTEVDAIGSDFVLDTGLYDVVVDTGAMGYDPLDNVGFQQIDVGDWVSVTGRFESEFMESKELAATQITTIG